MALSGSFNYTTTAADIITASLKDIAILGEGDSASTTQKNEALPIFNYFIKHLQNDGMPLWRLYDMFILPPTNHLNDRQYVQFKTDDLVFHSVFERDTLAAAVTAGATSFTTTSLTYETANAKGIDRVYYVDNNGDLVSKTINGTGGTTFSITAGFAANVAVGATLYFVKAGYIVTTSSSGMRPLRIIEGYRSIAGGVDVPLSIYTWQEYNQLSNKGAEGTPICLYHEYKADLPVESRLYAWPKWTDTSVAIKIRAQVQFDDIDAETNDIAFPQEWYLTVMKGLAWLLAPRYGIPIAERQALEREYEKLKDEAIGFGMEEGSIYFGVNLGGR